MAAKSEKTVLEEYVETVLKPRRDTKVKKKAETVATPVVDSRFSYPPKPGQILVNFNETLARLLRRDFDSLIKPAGLTWEVLWPTMPHAAFVTVEYFDGKSMELQTAQIRFDRAEVYGFAFQVDAMNRLKALHAPVLMSAGQVVAAAIRAYELKKA